MDPFASRRSTAALSLLVAAIATAAIMLLCDYFESVALLPTQLTLIAAPIALPLFVASGTTAWRRPVWCITGTILAIGWGYVIHAERQVDPGDGASLAVIAGWAASLAALVTALLLALVSAIATRRTRPSTHR